MTTSGTIVLVVPCYNEADRLQCAAFRACAKRIPLVRFVFVDDGSTDGTLRILEGLRRHDPDAFAIHRLDSNRGKAEAVRVGILEALNEDPSLVGFWDADLATPLDELERFLEKFGENPALEMVFGSRVKLLGRHIRRNPARHYIGRVFATTVAALLGIPIYDSQCGAKLFRVTEGFRELFSEPFVSRWIFDVEILARAMKRRRREQAAPLTQVVHEQPLMQWRDVRGSKIRVRDSLVVGLDLLRIYWKYLRA